MVGSFDFRHRLMPSYFPSLKSKRVGFGCMNGKVMGLLLVSVFLFSLVLLCVPVKASTTYYVTLEQGNGGRIFMDTHLGTYSVWGWGEHGVPSGTTVTISGVADAGWIFSNFTYSGVFNGSTVINPINPSVVSNFTIKANFVQATVNYTVTFAQGAHGDTRWNYNTYQYKFTEVGVIEVGNMSEVGIVPYGYYGYLLDAIHVVGGVDDGLYDSGDLVSGVLWITVNADVAVTVTYRVNPNTTPFPTGAIPTMHPTVTPTPTNVYDDSTLGSIISSPLGQIVMILLILFVPPMMVLVGAPKVGFIGFFIILLLMVLVGVNFGIIPQYFLIVMVIGLGLMFFSAFKKGV